MKVKNIGSTVKTVRLKNPTTSFFSIVCKPPIPVCLPPGLELSIEITFLATANENFYDR